jgi:hypothetical protein
MPQQELIAKFREDQRQVKWTKRQARTMVSVPDTPYGLKSGSDERVELDPYQESHIRLANVFETEEEEELLKDLSIPTSATVTRHGRFKLVDFPGYTFLISYLTPVAYHDKAEHKFYRTSKWWSMTTEQHIRKWARMIWKSPSWANDPSNQEPSEFGGKSYARYPDFAKKPQKEVSQLLFSQLRAGEMSPGAKRQMYHVDPSMRRGGRAEREGWGAREKHHDTGKEGLPVHVSDLEKAGVPAEFYQDFKPDVPEFHPWETGGYGRRTYEPYEPDERGRRPKKKD